MLYLREVVRISRYLDKIDFPKYEFFAVLMLMIRIVRVFTSNSDVSSECTEFFFSG
jgi:hypothetical protein